MCVLKEPVPIKVGTRSFPMTPFYLTSDTTRIQTSKEYD